MPALSVAIARDNHYHDPPDYLVIEPEDTADRTQNLQQRNTNGYKFQGSGSDFAKAQKIVASWGKDMKKFNPTREYQERLRQLLSRFTYRLDTNFAKMDRIVHPDIEAFKTRVLGMTVAGMPLVEWARTISSDEDERIREAFRKNLAI